MSSAHTAVGGPGGHGGPMSLRELRFWAVVVLLFVRGPEVVESLAGAGTPPGDDHAAGSSDVKLAQIAGDVSAIDERTAETARDVKGLSVRMRAVELAAVRLGAHIDAPSSYVPPAGLIPSE